MRTESSSDHSVSIVAKHGGDIGPIQRTRPRGLRRVRRQSRPNAAKDDPSRANPRKPRASDAEEALAQIWDDLPDAVRTAVKDAGWTPDSPPGLGFSQIRGDSSDHSQTAAAELYKQADEETKKLLKMAGFQSLRGPLLRPFKRCIKRTRLTKSTLQI